MDYDRKSRRSPCGRAKETSLRVAIFCEALPQPPQALALYSGEIARHEISILTRTISIDNLPDAFHDFRIVQISDIHYDEYTEPYFVRRVIAQVNSLAPDLVLLTGDYISFTPMPRDFVMGAMYRCADALATIACPRTLRRHGQPRLLPRSARPSNRFWPQSTSRCW